MQHTERLYQRYLEELQNLNKFKENHSDHYFNTFEDLNNDPYTRHLIEALSFFISHNSVIGEEKIVGLYQRLFSQYFPYLSHPLPAMAMIQFIPSIDSAEKIECGDGAEISILTPEGKKGGFQTLGPFSILPIQLRKFHFVYSKDFESKIYIQFSSNQTLQDQIGDFKLYINHLNHFPSALSLAATLEQKLKKIEIEYDVEELQSRPGIPCSFAIEPFSENPYFNHPIEKIRSLLHFPEQELFLNIKVPPHSKKWRTFTLCLHLGKNWPEHFQLTKEMLIPFVVPIVNLRKKEAELIHCRGMKDFYPILYPNPEENFYLHSIQGIYLIENHRKVPIKPGIATQGKTHYEIETFFDSEKNSHRLILDFPDAFEHPKLVSVEALWHQPWFSEELDKELKATLMNRPFAGLELRLLGKISSSENPSLNYTLDSLTRLLALKNQSELELEEILLLMDALKTHRKSYFKEIPTYIKNLEVNDLPGFRSSFITTEYNFFLEKLEDKNRDLALLYFKHMRNFLDFWLPNIGIELTVICSQFKKTFKNQS